MPHETLSLGQSCKSQASLLLAHHPRKPPSRFLIIGGFCSALLCKVTFGFIWGTRKTQLKGTLYLPPFIAMAIEGRYWGPVPLLCTLPGDSGMSHQLRSRQQVCGLLERNLNGYFTLSLNDTSRPPPSHEGSVLTPGIRAGGSLGCRPGHDPTHPRAMGLFRES